LDGKEGIDMTAIEKIDKILSTRQLLYTLLVIAIILPLIYPVGLPIGISSRTKAVYDYIQDDSKVPPGSHVLIEIYYEVAARAELEPQVIALMKQLFEKNCKLVFLSTITYGPLAFQFLQASAPDVFEGKTYGEDYVFLGYIAGQESAVASLAKSITGTVATDNYGNSTSSLPLIVEANDASAYALVIVASSGTDTFGWYVRQWYTPYHTPLLFGALSVIAPSIEPYVNAGQAVGMLTGQRSAAEYELLVGRKGLGIASMDAQSFAHGLILVFIIVGNIVFAYTKLSKRGEKK
jgi:hypothetical protein